ncbi:MAG: Mth938-like domain-containing protein [Povalibacter sp.]
MKLTDNSRAAINVVRAYAPGEIRVGEDVMRQSFLLSADRLVTDWRPQSVTELRIEDLQPIFELDPEIVVLGSGTRQKFPEHSLLAQILSRGIGCEVMDTGAACRTYNVLVSEDRRAVAALFVND